MKLLLDTHAFLWWVLNDPKLSQAARAAIEDPNNEVYLSAATGWEIAIKASIGKLMLPAKPDDFIERQMVVNGFVALPIEMRHALGVYGLPMAHRDPFDRILVAQSRVEGMTILTCDPLVTSYPVTTLW